MSLRDLRHLRDLRFLAIALLLLAWHARPGAHDIPADVLIRGFVKPEGQVVRVLLRVPLSVMRDINFPLYGPGFLDLARSDTHVREGAETWILNSVAVYEGETRLAGRLAAVRVSLPSDLSYQAYDTALAHVGAPPLPPETALIWNQAFADVLLEYPVTSDRSEFAIHPAFERLGIRVVTVLRFLPPGSAERAFEFHGNPGLVRLDPRWHHAAWLFVKLGFEHILDGIDHLLFVFCLVLPFRRFRELILIVTAFTVAHSITLASAAFGLAPDGAWFPPLVEVLIAASILYMAFENIVGVQAVQRRWVITFAFGLVHGFGFSFALKHTLQFAGSHLVTSLLSFNVGVETGQILVVALMVPALALLFRYVVGERIGIIILSALVAHTAWHWMTERWVTLRAVEWPALTAGGAASAIRWLMAFVILIGIVWLVSEKARRAVRGVNGQDS
jgi:hypothetical protein